MVQVKIQYAIAEESLKTFAKGLLHLIQRIEQGILLEGSCELGF